MQAASAAGARSGPGAPAASTSGREAPGVLRFGRLKLHLERRRPDWLTFDKESYVVAAPPLPEAPVRDAPALAEVGRHVQEWFVSSDRTARSFWPWRKMHLRRMHGDVALRVAVISCNPDACETVRPEPSARLSCCTYCSYCKLARTAALDTFCHKHAES